MMIIKRFIVAAMLCGSLVPASTIFAGKPKNKKEKLTLSGLSSDLVKATKFFGWTTVGLAPSVITGLLSNWLVKNNHLGLSFVPLLFGGVVSTYWAGVQVKKDGDIGFNKRTAWLLGTGFGACGSLVQAIIQTPQEPREVILRIFEALAKANQKREVNYFDFSSRRVSL